MPNKVIDEIPPDYLQAIGKVVVSWNQLDIGVNLLLIFFLGKDIKHNRSHIVFAHMAFPQKLDVMGALVEDLIKQPGNKYLEAYKLTVLPLLKQAQGARNSVVHAMWGAKSGKVRKAFMSARGTFKFSWTVADLKEIQIASQQIESAYQSLISLLNQK